MAAKGGTLLSLGVASAVLAAFVPGVFDPAPALVASPVVAVEKPVLAEPPVPIALPATPPVRPAAETAPASSPQAPETIVSPFGHRVVVQRRRSGIPLGCERLVSPLVHSSASATIGRCIT